MDCTPPESWPDVAEWRADRGAPVEMYGALAALGDELLDAAAAGCPPLDTSAMPFVWSGSCETASGYRLTTEGMSWFGGDPMTSEGGYRLVASFEPTVFADGSWPTGDIVLESESRISGTGNFGGGRRLLTAAWTFEDAGTTGLPLTGTLDAERGESWGGCGGDYARYVGEADACAFESAYGTGQYVAAPDDRESHTFVAGDWSGEVHFRTCGTREGVAGSLHDLLDADWAVLPLTDADADGCAVEDCDCDDADATIHPGADDPEGDGLDRDCDGRDTTFDDCGSAIPTCAESAVLEEPDDTGPGDTSDLPPEDEPAEPRPPTSDGARGCMTTTGAPSGFLGVLVILGSARVRRRRTSPTG